MPFIHVRYATKPDPATEAALVRDLTSVVIEHLRVPAQTVGVVLEPVPSSRWGVGGELLSESGI